ncbi:nucleotidyltransferase [Candidatus Marinimicrobia bacterium]|nr:nucleotidyltransferase [Candidatus Neomarinimicrobiota bacterium]
MRRVNLIPMAGEGQRFIDAGYKTPKPLIDIDGLPMVVWAAKSLPSADLWIFICQEKHITEANIDQVLVNHFPGALVLTIDHLTEGQASTCLLARDYLLPDDQLIIGACDNGMKYNSQKYEKMMKKNDALVWTFRNNPAVLQNPKMYGWVSIDESCRATGVSCKVPISDNPLHDHAIVGTFSFRKASYFLDCADKMIEKNRTINNEFYLDVVLDECVINGYKITPFEVNNYICWGTPADLIKYEEIENE